MVKGMPITLRATKATTETKTETQILTVATTMLEAIPTLVEGTTITTIIHSECLMKFGNECPRRKRMHIIEKWV